MSLEQKINYQLNKFPAIKKYIKRAYQLGMYAISPKIKSDGNIMRISPDDNKHEYFFGYYDKSPWDITDRYMLCIRANNTWTDVSPKENADILLIDTFLPENEPKRVRKIAQTRAWNVQQSCMLQWMGPDYSSRILYNDYRCGKYCAVILTLATGEEQVINAPVYTVSADGKLALTLDFSRLYNLRPGYGYHNVPETTVGVDLPDTTAVWTINLKSGEITPLLNYTDFASFQPRAEMQQKGSVHKINHLMLSPNGKRFMVLYRWFNGQRKYTRLVTCNVDGTDMYVLSDDDMVSHCFWKDDEYILAFENKHKSGPGYYLMKDKSQEYCHCWPQFSNDGHPSYSPDRNLIVTDTYPNRARVASINLMDGNEKKNESKVIARVFAPFKYDNDTRCDLHPRWNHRGDKVCFDSVFEGHRGLYVVDISESAIICDKMIGDRIINENPKYTIITPMYNSFNLMARYFKSLQNQTYKNFEVIIVDDCSTDNSYERACQYAANSSLDITVLKTERNMGPGNARNIGMNNARGEWITFVDNDDWVSVTLLEKVEQFCTDSTYNCIVYDYSTTDGTNMKRCYSMYEGETGSITISECIKNVRNHSVCKVYRRACIEGVRYPELRRHEDVGFVCVAINACKSIYYLKESLYYYYQRPSSLSNDKCLDETDMIKAFSIVEQKLASDYQDEIMEKSVSDLLYGVLLIMCKAGKSNTEIKRYIQEYETKYPDWYSGNAKNKMGRAKRLFLSFAHIRNIGMLKMLAEIHSRMVG